MQPIDPLPSYKAQKTPAFGFKLISPKHKHFLNSGHANFNLKNGIANRQTLMINSLDAMNQNIQQDEHLILYKLSEIDVFADVTEDIIQGVVMVNNGYWMQSDQRQNCQRPNIKQTIKDRKRDHSKRHCSVHKKTVSKSEN